ncbi:MAG: acyl-CoA thioesterase [bacterium]|nr:acyl-CoA thioesterase [bacterium]
MKQKPALKPKKASESALHDYPYMLFETDINPRGTAFGGQVMKIADTVAAIVSLRHSRMDCVTVFVDSFKFVGPAVKGEMLIYKASVNRVWETSMEIGIRVCAEESKTGKRRHVISAYFTFVAIGEDGKPTALPKVIPMTKEEKRRYKQAQQRRERRLAEEKEKQKSIKTKNTR